MRKSKYMTFKEWLNIVLDKGLICERYLPAVDAARSRKQFMDVVLDINGMAFLCDMESKGYKLPYDVITNEFWAYMNGRYIHTKSSENGSYTTTMYCSVSTPEEITVSTTVTGLFNCKCKVFVPQNRVCQFFIDNGSDIELHVADSSKCYVNVWAGGSVSCVGDGDVHVKHKSNANG